MAYNSQAGQAARGIVDADTSCKPAAVALPNAANVVNTNAVDLGAIKPFPTTEKIQVKLTTTVATAANNLNLTFYLQDSADDNTSNYVNIGNCAKGLINEGSNVYAATDFILTLPPVTKRYVRACAAGEANGGNAADGTLTMSLLF
jgi:hypothetical protein